MNQSNLDKVSFTQQGQTCKLVLFKEYSAYDRIQIGEHPPTILELGSGTGIVGLSLAALGASVVLTDPAMKLHLKQDKVTEEIIYCSTMDIIR